jgi:phage gp36-like protein
VTYITDAELLSLGLPGAALSVVASATRDQARVAASDEASGYLKKRFSLPIVAWGSDLKRKVADIAAYDLMTFRGFDPGSESGALIVKRRDDAVLWLRDVAKGIVEPTDIEDTTASVDEQSPLVSSDTGAGWAWPTTASEEA